ncbi:preprotein translocase subunit SecE [Candidatus Scalindua japonica]|uniref:Protein translocase subunit SecE n=1 Tax=Candidatus Scalindua japonica TaxID=1284222 RepID=A0A286U297_9BACT|nr:preprotein translocase subunit SecE [Candidatus Scalindua japonica]GAX62245.1 preprotein translocase subunit SecE [Candidatus Scalindua japonica]
MTFNIYRKGLGVYARSAVAGLFGLAAIFAAYSLYGAMIDLPELYAGSRVPILGISLTWGGVGACSLFVVCCMLICVFTTGFEVGLKGLDNKSKKAVEFFIETQTELQKVSWPARSELIGSTIVVIVCLVVLGVYVFCVDWVVSTFMKAIDIL